MHATRTHTAGHRDTLNQALVLAEFDTVAAADGADDEWNEFLALGLAANPADWGSDMSWQHAPVLLTY